MWARCMLVASLILLLAMLAVRTVVLKNRPS
jgi:hypothetical protein